MMDKNSTNWTLSKKLLDSGRELVAKAGLKRNKSSQSNIFGNSFSTDDGSGYLTNNDSDSICKPPFPIRSCFKGSRQSNSDSFDSRLVVKQREHVKISKKKSKREHTKQVDCYIRYSSDLWWNKQELQQTRQEQLDYSNSDHRSLQSLGTFLNSYYLLRDQLALADNSQVSEAIENGNADPIAFFSKKSFNKLVKGFKKEFNGIERYIGHDCEKRRNHVLDFVKQVVEFYKMEHSSKMTGSVIDDENVASYARSLSMKDKCWSYLIGTVQHVAAFDSETKMSTKQLFY